MLKKQIHQVSNTRSNSKRFWFSIKTTRSVFLLQRLSVSIFTIILFLYGGLQIFIDSIFFVQLIHSLDFTVFFFSSIQYLFGFIISHAHAHIPEILYSLCLKCRLVLLFLYIFSFSKIFFFSLFFISSPIHHCFKKFLMKFNSQTNKYVPNYEANVLFIINFFFLMLFKS